MAEKPLNGHDKVVHKTKTVKLHHHHAKPYRKRHIGLLILMLVVSVILLVTVVQYQLITSNSINNSINFVSDLFSGNKDYNLKIHSTYGFDITFDQQKFYTSAIDAQKGDLFLGADVSENRPYSIVRIAPTLVNSKTSQSALTFTYHQDTTYETSKLPQLEDLQPLALSDGLITASSFENTASKRVDIDGHIFLRSVWTLKPAIDSSVHIKSEFVTYVAVINNQPVTIVINYGFGGSENDTLYQPIISSIRFGLKEQAYISQTAKTVALITSQRTLLDSVLFSNIASAAASSSKDASSEKIAALYSPAVSKIYNVFCMDVTVGESVKFTDLCNGGVMGSGFFVSQDGYIATNGHVASSDPKGMAIMSAYYYYQKGEPKYLNYLTTLFDYKESDYVGGTEDEAWGLLIRDLYKIPDSLVKTSNDVTNLLVDLTDKSPDISALIEATTARKKYAVQDTIKSAKLVESDYRRLDNAFGMGYKASDVAILKVDGSNYPVTKLGSISDVTQGSDLLILGYPGMATENGLVNSAVNTVTLTTGKVASIKGALGNGKKLIETDTTIGHGNSGGPALSAKGDVVGIATYRADGSGAADATYNYIRDIKDLNDLASKSSIKFDTNSKTQTEWEKGIDYFYTSHYSQAIEHFNEVKKLYSYNSRVDEFINKANKGIANGEDVKDFPVVAVSIVAVIALIGAGATVFVIIRHKKHHGIYANQVAEGNIQPFVPGVPAPMQQVVVPVSGPPATNPNSPPIVEQPVAQPAQPSDQTQ